MFTLSIIFAHSAFAVVNAEFSLVPLVNEAVIGESTYFDCTTTTLSNEVHWYHNSVGAKDHEDICIQCLGRLHPLYKNRFTVERIGTGTFRLKINSVQREDAGRYMCQDNGGIGDSLLAELVVLDVNINNSELKMVLGNKQPVNCLANSSQPCNYTWKWVDGVHEVVVSYQSTLRPQKPGWHICDATCSIRGNQCTVLSRLLQVSQQTYESSSKASQNLLITLFALVCICAVVVCRTNSHSRGHYKRSVVYRRFT